MYEFKKIEQKWRKKWEEEGIYEPDLDNPKKPFYNLMMFPYPSAEGLHVGNMYAFTGSDIYGRFQRMQGFDVFEPIGLDGFGIHAENYALKIGKNPKAQSKVTEENFYHQFQMIGNGFAWNERLETYDPEYYKWTQWIFTKLFEQGLAYRKKASVNWCPSCNTVLADEQVIAGECERCSTEVTKRDLEQWFFKITNYADRLLENLDGIDWTPKIKTAQRNWIGRSEGARLTFPIKDSEEKIEVFTTRPDTLFGATYMVLAPEHELIEKLADKIENKKEVEEYVKKTAGKTENQRIIDEKNKTGVELKGIKAINPATGEEIPIWIADYVLASYGTGAIMAVPAHDERDFEFATKFKLQIIQVVEPEYLQTKEPGIVRKDLPFVERDGIIAIVKHWSEEKYLCLKWKKVAWGTWVTGGIEEGQTPETAARAEVLEEVGYKNLKLKKDLGIVHGKFYHIPKAENRWVHAHCLYFELEDDVRDEIIEEEKERHEPVWLSKDEIEEFLTADTHRWAWRELNGENFYTGSGVLTNSGKFDGLDSEEAKWKITDEVGGKKETNFHLRDWLISRQRYWGPPIPMIFCEPCAEKTPDAENAGWHTVPEKDLPVLLPEIENFRPEGTGEAPLASHPEFYETTCPKCGGTARRETDVSDTFLDSAWYFYRYPDIKNSVEAFDKKRIAKWLPVNAYIGGAEHAVLHLLYSRFLAMVFKEMKLIDFEEPFTMLRSHGLLIKDGFKMSKSKGNVVNPDEFIGRFGADVVRAYLMFIGPFQEGGDWRDQGIMGVVRFLDRIWEIGERNEFKDEKEISPWFHASIKKVSEDLPSLKYNTAIAELMSISNKWKGGDINRKDFETFLLMLAPIAPFITEELWNKLGNDFSIHTQPWPAYKEEYLVEDTIKLIVQINGKLRATIETKKGISEEDAKRLALADERVSRHLDSEPKKVIFVQDKLINFVI